jgi:hypothetical protein
MTQGHQVQTLSFFSASLTNSEDAMPYAALQIVKSQFILVSLPCELILNTRAHLAGHPILRGMLDTLDHWMKMFRSKGIILRNGSRASSNPSRDQGGEADMADDWTLAKTRTGVNDAVAMNNSINEPLRKS